MSQNEGRHSSNALLWLPRELRDETYALLFLHHESENKPLMRIRENVMATVSPPALMQTCKQMYYESYPLFIRSLKLVISEDVDLDATQRWLDNKTLQLGPKDVRAIAFSSFEMFRTVLPGERCVKWDRNQGMPWVPREPIGPVIYITGSDSPSINEETIPKSIQFLLALPGLRHVEISMPVRDVIDKSQLRVPHYYDLRSLTAIVTLTSVTLNLDCAGGVIWRIYRHYNRRRKDGVVRPLHDRIKNGIDGGWGLKSWLEEGFRDKAMVVDVRCVLHQVEPYSKILSPSDSDAKESPGQDRKLT